jgi:hypothetical protein
MILGTVCIILGAEYAWTYCVYTAASFGILYVADTIIWLCAGSILFTEGLQNYLRALRVGKREVELESNSTG